MTRRRWTVRKGPDGPRVAFFYTSKRAALDALRRIKAEYEGVGLDPAALQVDRMTGAMPALAYLEPRS